jgi:hypothetical protein
MKKLLILLFIAGLSITRVSGQQTISGLAPLLNLYYDIKNDLVKADAAETSTKATEFLRVINRMDDKTLTAAENSVFSSLKEKLVMDAKYISDAKEISKQRDYFKTFSDNFYVLAKETRLSAEPVYQQFCPMKKSYWLSSEAAIKNPYYGNQMLTCGKITDTLKP